MRHLTLKFEKIPQLSVRDQAYAKEDASLRPFYKYEVGMDAFRQVIQDKQKEQTNREILVAALKTQYQSIGAAPKVKANIEALLEKNTYTITTAHQPSLATGPLYFIYKIISTLNLAENLNAKYPDFRFVPIYIQGSEDHDFEEINHFNLFGKRLTWEGEAGGSVGKMSTEGIAPVLEELKKILGESEKAAEVFNLLFKAYGEHKTLDEAIFYLVNELFARFGLVVVIGSVPCLKRLFIPIMKKELLEQVSEKLVTDTIAKLEKKGFKGQANPRKINLFYLGENYRNRIVLEEGVYKVLDTKLEFTKNEILEELEQHPERFSPNVIMRPLYQETILPNLAYIGGGGELAYWLERKIQFDFFDLNFPMLIRRDSVLWIDAVSNKKINKLELSVEELFLDEEILIKRFVKENTAAELSLKKEQKELEELFNSILEKAIQIDPALKKTVIGEKTKVKKGIQQLEAKLLRAEKKNFEDTTNQIRNLKSKLFPSGLQERHDNFITFYLKHGDGFIDTLKAHLDPMKKEFNVFMP